MSEMSPQEKVKTCLTYIDSRLEVTSEQTIQIAEMMIEDIKELSNKHLEAIENNTLEDHLNKMRDVQMGWMNHLQEIILEQANRDLSGQVILALQEFTDKLGSFQLETLDFELPSAVASKQDNSAEQDYIDQDEIDKLFG